MLLSPNIGHHRKTQPSLVCFSDKVADSASCLVRSPANQTQQSVNSMVDDNFVWIWKIWVFHNIVLGQTIQKRMNEPKHKIVMICHEIVLEVSIKGERIPYADFETACSWLHEFATLNATERAVFESHFCLHSTSFIVKILTRDIPQKVAHLVKSNILQHVLYAFPSTSVHGQACRQRWIKALSGSSICTLWLKLLNLRTSEWRKGGGLTRRCVGLDGKVWHCCNRIRAMWKPTLHAISTKSSLHMRTWGGMLCSLDYKQRHGRNNI